jgi:hypothetical protein
MNFYARTPHKVNTLGSAHHLGFRHNLFYKQLYLSTYKLADSFDRSVLTLLYF